MRAKILSMDMCVAGVVPATRGPLSRLPPPGAGGVVGGRGVAWGPSLLPAPLHSGFPCCCCRVNLCLRWGRHPPPVVPSRDCCPWPPRTAGRTAGPLSLLPPPFHRRCGGGRGGTLALHFRALKPCHAVAPPAQSHVAPCPFPIPPPPCAVLHSLAQSCVVLRSHVWPLVPC